MALPALSPIVSEFETEEQEASYDRWFRAKVSASLADTRPSVPHAEVKARTAAIIARAYARENAEKARR